MAWSKGHRARGIEQGAWSKGHRARGIEHRGDIKGQRLRLKDARRMEQRARSIKKKAFIDYD
jgi:hypothetical protein